MKVTGIELRTVRIPLRTPFETSFGTQHERVAILVRVMGEISGQGRRPTEVEGWGECVAPEAPLYSSEYAAGAAEVMRRFLFPMILDHVREHGQITAEMIDPLLAPVVGHRMAKAAIEMAMLDAQLRGAALSLAAYLGAARTVVPAGISIGIQPSVAALLDVISEYMAQGYPRIKLKIKPGWDVAPVEAVRERYGELFPVQVDANAAYTLADSRALSRLDAFDLLMIEQPLARDDLRQHAELARMLRTPICLDESITSVRSAADAIALRSCQVINIKVGRVGGFLNGRRIHDLCQANGVPVWCGGMVETGLGRAGNVALAALPGFTLPGDLSGSDRFYDQDITEPIVAEDGLVAVPTGPGLGVAPIMDVLQKFTVGVEWIDAR